jgi:hypothetical protein
MGAHLRRTLGSGLLLGTLASTIPGAIARGGSQGPTPGGCGVPALGAFAAEATCTLCHDGFALNPDREGSIAIEGLPHRYSPGMRYSARIAVTQRAPEVRGFGFQLTAVTASGDGAGELALTEPARTQVVVDPVSARSYLEHTLAGIAPARAGEAAWSFEWIAPSSDVGDVAFFAVANAANRDGSKGGDRIYSTSPAPLALLRGPSSHEGEQQ